MEKFKNKGRRQGKVYNAFDIAVEDEYGKILAWYIGYYNPKTKSYRLYPSILTTQGKAAGYKMDKQTIKEETLKSGA